MGKGKRYELRLKKDINRDTRPCVKAHRPDYSGSSVGEVADLMVLWQENRYSDQQPCGHPERKVAYLELKKRTADSGNRSTVMAGSSDDQNGVGELEELVNESPSWTDQYVVVKFDNRKPIVIDASRLLHWLRREQEGWGQEWLAQDRTPGDYKPCKKHGARLTPSGNISMVKPTLDSWESSQAADSDHREILRAIGVKNYYHTDD